MTAAMQKQLKPQGELLQTLGVRTLKITLAAWLLAALLLAHGCHRHEDNELFARLAKPAGGLLRTFGVRTQVRGTSPAGLDQ
jgi:hypothetical protein